MPNFLKIMTICFLFIALGSIRFFENSLFYDPFIQFFKEHYFLKEIPNIDLIKIITHTLFRYSLNTLISIVILFVTFKNKEIIRFSLLLYCLVFIVLIILYTLIMANLSKETYQLFFYIRRFLIQPILILLLLPAFYYQQKIKGN